MSHIEATEFVDACTRMQTHTNANIYITNRLNCKLELLSAVEGEVKLGERGDAEV